MLYLANPIDSLGTDIDRIANVLSYYKNGYFYFFFIVIRVSFKGLGWPSLSSGQPTLGG
jgi:hypothetical protein